MRTIVAGVVLFLTLASLVPAGASFKQEQFYDWGSLERTQRNVLGESTAAENELPDPGILPGTPLYFGKRLGEQMQLFFTFNQEAKTQQKLVMVNTRLAEARALVKAGKVEEGLQVMDEFEMRMREASDDFSTLENKGKNIAELANFFEKTTAVHTTVLENMTPSVPTYRQNTVERAISASQKGMDRAAQALGEPAVPIDLVDRMNSLRGQGIITQGEATSLLQSGKREEARKVFKKYVDRGLVPSADFKRFDSSQAKYFADDYEKTVEINKLKELGTLEKQRVNEETKKKVEEFAKTYQPGDIVPTELRPAWARTIRLEEVQKTISPDKTDERAIKKDTQLYQKYQEMKDRVRPTTDEIKMVEEYKKQNPGKELPPEYMRTESLRKKFGVVKPGERPPPGHEETTLLNTQTSPQTGAQPSNQTQETRTQEFRQPFVPPSRPKTPGQQSPSYKQYQEEKSGFYKPPPSETTINTTQQRPATQLPQQTQIRQEVRQEEPVRQAPQTTESCPPGSSWNGSTCHFPQKQSTYAGESAYPK